MIKKNFIVLAVALMLGISGCAVERVQGSQGAEVRSSAASPSAVASIIPTAVVTWPSSGTETMAPVDEENTAQVSPPVAEAADPVLSEEPNRPSDESVLGAYREAAEAYSWFAGYSDAGLQLDTEEIQVQSDNTFYRVMRPGLESVDTLRAYLKTLLSDEIVDGLLSSHAVSFIDGEDGGLYALPAGRGSDITKGAVTLIVLWPEEEPASSCTVQATVEVLDAENGFAPTGQVVYTFPYAQVGDKWVFTHFESIF